MDPPSIRRVKKALRAWTPRLFDSAEQIPIGPVAPVGEPILIEPFEEIQFLRRTKVSGEAMALVCWRDALYLVKEDDLETRTMRVVRSN